MIRRLLLLCAISGIWGAIAQPSKTDGTLRHNCDAVTNLYSVEFTYSTPVSASVKYATQTTVLNRSGSEKGNFVCYVDPTVSLKSFSGTITDAQGRELRKLKRSDLKYTEFSFSSLADDTAFYMLECLSPSYPYTVRLEYELTLKNGILGFPSFTPVTSTGTMLEKGIYTVSVPRGMQFRYKCLNMEEPVRSTDKDRNIYTWTIGNIPALKSEPASPPLWDRVPQVLSAPDTFEYEDTRGNMQDWASYGSWMCSLLEGRDVLPEALKQEIHQLTDTISSPREKIRALYDYMGRTTRYVSIQLGIGGQQPMKAAEVYKTKFGDCKALSNYLRAMLAECGIASDYVIIHTDRHRMFRDFSSPAQANHAILRVPLETETLWLECTNTDVPFGHVHNNIAGHDAIAFHKKTGEFVTLPQYPDTLNRTLRTIDITIREDGSAQGHISVLHNAAQYDQMMAFPKLDAKKQNDLLLSELKIPMIRVEGIEYQDEKTPVPHFQIDYDITSSRYVSISGTRYFLPLTPFLAYETGNDRERSSDIYCERGYMDATYVRLHIPENMEVEATPRSCNVQTPFGHYILQVTAEKGCITVMLSTLTRRGIYPREEFEQYREFITGRAKAFNASIVLKK